MRLNFWRYQIILSFLYLIWSGLFINQGILNQIVFNFAVFYPVGLLAGYTKSMVEAYRAALIFNLATYLFAFGVGINLTDWFMVVCDFISLLVIIRIGIFMGKRLAFDKAQNGNKRT